MDRMGILHWCVFIIAPAAFVTEADRRVFLGTLIAMGIYLGFTGIFEILGPHALVFPRYINNPHVGIHWGRARGPFVEAEVMGTALWACILASMVALRTWRSRLPRQAAVLAIAVCSVSLLLTFDRTTWLAVGISAPLILVMIPELRKYLLPTVAVAVAAVGISYLTIPTVRDHIKLRASDSQTIRDREAVDGAGNCCIDFVWIRARVEQKCEGDAAVTVCPHIACQCVDPGDMPTLCPYPTQRFGEMIVAQRPFDAAARQCEIQLIPAWGQFSASEQCRERDRGDAI